MTNYFFIVVLFLGSFSFSVEPIALISKSIGNTKYKISSENDFNSTANINTPILHGNSIITKNKSFSQIVYLDDGSTISAFHNTEVTINGVIENRLISKQVDLAGGIMRVKILKQFTRLFKLTTPNSELSCQECDFWIDSDQITGDRFYKISGNIFLTNPSMNEMLELTNDSTIISLKDTKMEIYQTTINENNYLESLMLNAGVFHEKTKKELEMISDILDWTTDIQSNVVEIRLKNSLNIERKIILIYTK